MIGINSTNPVVTLRAQAGKVDFSMLRAGKDNAKAHSGYQAYKDFPRMDFVINKKDIDQNFINQLYAKHASLIENDENGKKNCRVFAKEVFTGVFIYAGAQIPSDPILEELITNCNQAGYEFIYAPFMAELLTEHALFMNVNGSNVDRKVYIDCRNSNSVKVECKTTTIPVDSPRENRKAIFNMSLSVGFTLESKSNETNVTYHEGELSIDVPREWENDRASGEEEQLYSDTTMKKSLIDKIIENFLILIEKFINVKPENRQNIYDMIKNVVDGSCNSKVIIIKDTGHSPLKIECSLGNPLEVNSYLESVEPHVHNNEHGNTPKLGG